MKLIINIPEDRYNEIMKDDYIPDGNFRRNCLQAIKNGTPLDNPTQMIDKSNFDQRQYKADTDTAYECGRASVLSVIDDIKAEILDCMTDGIKYYDCGRDDGLKLATLIIDKHIGKE